MTPSWVIRANEENGAQTTEEQIADESLASFSLLLMLGLLLLCFMANYFLKQTHFRYLQGKLL
jgi:hypothetical protein